MGYLIGAGPLDPAVKRYNGGTSSFTMDNSGTTNGTLLWVDGVAQVPGTDYNVSGTTITTTTAAGAGTNNVTSLQLFNTGLITTPGDNTVATAKIQDDAVTLAKMAAGTDGNIISYDASGNPVAIATGNDGQVLTSAGAGQPPAFEAVSAGLTLATEQATTSGDTVTFSSIPSGTTFIVMGLDEVSLASSAVLHVQIGDSGGLETSGYNSGTTQSDSSASTIASTTGFRIIRSFAAYADLNSGSVILTKQDATNNTWVCNSNLVTDGTVYVHTSAGVKSLSAELDRVALYADGTFDAGAVNIAYM